MDKKLYRLLINGNTWSTYDTIEQLNANILDLERRYPKFINTAKIEIETYTLESVKRYLHIRRTQL